MRQVQVLLLVGMLLGGCATTREAMGKFPERTQEAFADPVRRVHLLTQVSRLSTAASVAIGCTVFLAPTIVGMLLCPLAAVLYDYVVYEYVLEPLSVERVREGKPSLVGPYWETGPRADEGEFFTCGTVLTDNPTHTCRPAVAQ